jgi:hypothetical protein
MLNFITQARWGQAYEFLMSGSPPVFAQLLAVNAMFVLFFAVRRAADAEPLSGIFLLLTQLVFLAANLVVLLQREIEVWFRSMAW